MTIIFIRTEIAFSKLGLFKLETARVIKVIKVVVYVRGMTGMSRAVPVSTKSDGPMITPNVWAHSLSLLGK